MSGLRTTASIAYRLWMYSPWLLSAVMMLSFYFQHDQWPNNVDSAALFVMYCKSAFTFAGIVYYSIPAFQGVSAIFGVMYGFSDGVKPHVIDWGLFAVSQLYMSMIYTTYLFEIRAVVTIGMPILWAVMAVWIYLSRGLGSNLGPKIWIMLGTAGVTAFHVAVLHVTSLGKIAACMAVLLFGAAMLEFGLGGKVWKHERKSEAKETLLLVNNGQQPGPYGSVVAPGGYRQVVVCESGYMVPQNAYSVGQPSMQADGQPYMQGGYPQTAQPDVNMQAPTQGTSDGQLNVYGPPADAGQADSYAAMPTAPPTVN